MVGVFHHGVRELTIFLWYHIWLWVARFFAPCITFSCFLPRACFISFPPRAFAIARVFFLSSIFVLNYLCILITRSVCNFKKEM